MNKETCGERIKQITLFFDVAQRPVMGARVSELLSHYLLNRLKNIFSLEKVGLV